MASSSGVSRSGTGFETDAGVAAGTYGDVIVGAGARPPSSAMCASATSLFIRAWVFQTTCAKCQLHSRVVRIGLTYTDLWRREV